MWSLVIYIVSQLILIGAWVTGLLDPYQKQLQEMLLEAMGESKSLTAKKLVEDQNLSKIQDQLGNELGDFFGKQGLAGGLGTVLSKGL
ncbi:hypothetical protein N7539_001172 [Penicillium diatomitis]|uniref:Uncharacterized protein n=1 Tax=Penicillium diatomitis TaxID=2819901 RepID=A0A9W9XN40_9EURO|nr:uncharacterized protein N7539_001172 [Penicillium diatomitis]KAJ5496056.1 hypothetical protein N7539_001172 [Penicillium diatomitis]